MSERSKSVPDLLYNQTVPELALKPPQNSQNGRPYSEPLAVATLFSASLSGAGSGREGSRNTSARSPSEAALHEIVLGGIWLLP